MSEFEGLINKLLEQRPDLSREEIEQKIKQKKEKIGAGYLTDQGAIFLIASDMGITLSEPLKIEMGLKDLYAGAKEVTLETRVLNFSPSKQFARKDGSSFNLRTLTVYDKNSTASVKLWDEKANLPGLEDLKPGDLIKIIKAYVKSDLNGNPTINVGSGSSIEPIRNNSDIPLIDAITMDVADVKDNMKDIVVTGKVDSTINSIEFTNLRGEKNTALRLSIKGNNGISIRCILWNKNESNLPKMILPDAKITLYGVKTKSAVQGLEIHGNESTLIHIDGGKEIEPIIGRIVSLVGNETGNTLLQVVNKEKKLFNIIDSSGSSKIFKDGDVIEIMPSKVFGNSITIDENSFIRKLDENENIPKISELRTKIKEVRVGETYCIEAIILKVPGRREIQTKNGETVSLSEMFVEDDSGQIWIKGWRNQARMIDSCSIGEIVSVTGLNAKSGLEGRVELVLSAYSKITKKN